MYFAVRLTLLHAGDSVLTSTLKTYLIWRNKHRVECSSQIGAIVDDLAATLLEHVRREDDENGRTIHSSTV